MPGISARELRTRFQRTPQRVRRAAQLVERLQHVRAASSDLESCAACGEKLGLHRDPIDNAFISCDDLAILLVVAGRRIRQFGPEESIA